MMLKIELRTASNCTTTNILTKTCIKCCLKNTQLFNDHLDLEDVRSCFLRPFLNRSSISQILHHISCLLVINNILFSSNASRTNKSDVQPSRLIEWQMLLMLKIEKDWFYDSPKRHLFSLSTQNNSDINYECMFQCIVVSFYHNLSSNQIITGRNTATSS